MPTLEHNGLVEMFRANPSLAAHFLEFLFHRVVPSHTKVSVGEAALDQMLPIEFRADLVLELCDEDGVVVMAIVLEVQRAQDPTKKFVWPVYAMVLRAKKRCPALVLVIALDPEVARGPIPHVPRLASIGATSTHHRCEAQKHPRGGLHM